MEHVLLRFDEFPLEFVSLHHAITIQMVLKDLLFDDILTEFEQVDAMDKVLFRQVIAFTITDAFDCFHSVFLVFHDLFKTKELVFAKNDQS